MLVHVGGDGTALALVDCSQFDSFVSEDWAVGDVLESKWIKGVNERAICIWGTGEDAVWRVEVSDRISDRKGHREFESQIACSSGALHVINYDSLTMAAQFEHYKLPDALCQKTEVRVRVGLYRVRVVQLEAPESEWWNTPESEPHFLVELEPFEGLVATTSKIPWLQL